MATFMVMADASGDIALLECLPSRCAVFRPEGDWFAHANHARTPEMIGHDRYRSPDSFARRGAMERAVARELGRITPEIAAGILRDRSDARFVNDFVVGNALVLNAAIVHPASGTLWHSTSMQPHAPFGAYTPLRLAAGGPAARPIAPAAFLLSARAKQEREAIREARRAQLLSDAGELARAREIWDRLAQADGPLDPARIAWERALVRWRAGELEAAYAALAPLETAQGVFDARAHGLVARGVLADALGRRDEALRLYARAQAHLDSHPEYSFLDPLRARIAAGRAAPLSADTLPTTEHWMNLWW
jgi:hypothetical protein